MYNERNIYLNQRILSVELLEPEHGEDRVLLFDSLIIQNRPNEIILTENFFEL